MTEASPFKTSAQKDAERTAKRDAVLRAAVRMFNERGFHSTSLDDVAASLGISKRTIYHYLASKDQVLLECVTIGMQQIVQAAADVRGEDGTGRERLIRFLRRYAEIIMDDFGRCVVRTGEETLRQESFPPYRQLKRDIDQGVRAVIEDAVADGSIPPLDVKMAAFTLAGAINWIARWHEAEGPMAPADVATAMVDILMKGIAPGNGPGTALA